jgi:hypothetical protein
MLLSGTYILFVLLLRDPLIWQNSYKATITCLQLTGMGQETWVGVCTMTHARAQWSNLCEINLSYHRLKLGTSTSKNIWKKWFVFHNDKVHMWQWQKGVPIDKTYFGWKHLFWFLQQLMMKIDLALRKNGKPLLSSSYKEEKQTA